MNIDLLIQSIDQYRRQHNDTAVITDAMIEETKEYLIWSDFTDEDYNEHEGETLALRNAAYMGKINLFNDDIDQIIKIYTELIKVNNDNTLKPLGE